MQTNKTMSICEHKIAGNSRKIYERLRTNSVNLNTLHGFAPSAVIDWNTKLNA